MTVGQLQYSSFLLPLFAYLLARTVLVAAGSWSSTAVPGLLVAFGALTGTLLKADAITSLTGQGALLFAPQVQETSYAFLVDAASAIALFMVGVEAGLARRRRTTFGIMSRVSRARLVLAFIVPLIFGAGLALGFGTANGSMPAAIIQATFAMAAIFWLCSVRELPGLVAASISVCIAITGTYPGFGRMAWSLGLALAFLGLIAGLTRIPKALPGSFKAMLALGLAWSLRMAGVPWAVAGLTAGFASGMAHSGTRHNSISGRPAGFMGLKIAQASGETAHALAFISGLGFSLDIVFKAFPATLIVAGAALAASSLQGILAGDREPLVPTEAITFSALLVSKNAGLVSDATIAGLALAFVAGALLKRIRKGSSPASSGIPGLKAIVGVSRSGLVGCAVSFAATLASGNEPIRAACVTGLPGSSGLNSAEAEESLVHCVVSGASEGIHVLPTIIAANSVAEGLAKAASDRHAEAVLIGIGDKQKPDESNSEPASILDGLLEIYPGTVIAIRKPALLSASRKLVAIAMAGIEASPEFEQALGTIAKAWGHATRSMDSLIIGSPASALIEAAGGLLDPRSVRSVQSWRDAPMALASMASSKPGLVVFTSRPGSKSWNPGHERLPLMLSSAFPESTMVLWFLPVDGSAETTISPAQRLITEGTQEIHDSWPPLLSAAYQSGRVLAEMREEALVDAIRRLTDTILPGNRIASGRLSADFSAIARKEPIELAPGVLLLHAHMDGVPLPTLAIGSRKEGWPLVALQSPVKITVILVSPSESGPESHLEALTQIAMAFRNLGLSDRLLNTQEAPQ